ncbi:MAG: hypothetical protein HY959_07130 [Ignavibacteriae bacterium]|nr:hypothetical protein [Ignavibacteriota bacterium]
MKNTITKAVLVFFSLALILLFSNARLSAQEVIVDTTTTPSLLIEEPTTTTETPIITRDSTPVSIDTTLGFTTTSTESTRAFKYLFKEDEKDPSSWSHFRIDGKTEDDKKFREIQSVLGIEPPLGTITLSFNLTDPKLQMVTIGDENDPTAKQYPASQVPDSILMFMVQWRGINKVNLSKIGYNYASVFIEAIKKVRLAEFLAPPKRELEIVNTVAYINQYLNFFGGDPLGIPIKRGFGFSFRMGTPYSGPLETDMIEANFHMLGASIGVTTRIKEFVRKHSGGATKDEKESKFSNYNNIFTPKLGLEVNYVIPFGNFLQVGYYTSIDSGDYDPPLLVKNDSPDSSSTYRYMPNNVISSQSFFNWEFRYPLRVFRSTRSKIYIAQYLGEFHAGFVGRELTLANSIFDVRINATMGSAKRNFQLLLEAYISSIGEGFSLSSFAIGPSVRLTKSPSGSMGAVTILINARLKIGDFFDDTYK